MNVVMLSPYYAPHMGGVERHVEHIAEECEKDGHHITIFTHSHDKTLPPKETHGSITISRNEFASPLLNQFSTLFSHFLSKSTVSKLIERMEIWSWLLLHIPTFLVADVIHIHDVFFWYWPLRFLLFWKPVYITFHGFEAGSLPTTKAIHARSLAEKWTWGNICVGSWIQKWYGTKPTYVSYGGGDPPKVVPIPHSDKSHRRAVFIGRFEVDTGIQMYTETIGGMLEYEFDIYGYGKLEPWIDTYSNEVRNIHLRGKTADPYSVYPHYDLACVSSYLSILEAMQSKVLVVAYATDELKLDYLNCHPRRDCMIVIERKDQLESFLQTYAPEKYAAERERAYTWASRQTWKSVYETYKCLWSGAQ